ncbi:MAG: F0F1 ATP synthase subunit delta, partial [Ignavibacteria bacterium]|nr:F0F1 ATP synthase subunit delta [Ignavibacteria bacterium]
TSTVKSESKFLADLQNIISKVIKSEVELTEKTDASILGGFIINIDDIQYDASIKHKLEKIQRELLSSN